MAQSERVFRCDACSRVVATPNSEGGLTVEVRHDKETHRTEIAAHELARIISRARGVTV